MDKFVEFEIIHIDTVFENVLDFMLFPRAIMHVFHFLQKNDHDRENENDRDHACFPFFTMTMPYNKITYY